MTDRCEPPPELRGVDGWHWVQIEDWPATINRWVWDAHEAIGFWHPLISDRTRYIAPVATPAEVSTLRARVAELEKVVALYQAEIGAFTGRGTTLARLAEIDQIARAALSPTREQET